MLVRETEIRRRIPLRGDSRNVGLPPHMLRLGVVLVPVSGDRPPHEAFPSHDCQ